MKFKPYEKYKKVDLPWIDEIPSHWVESRVKAITKLKSTRQKDIDNELELLSVYRDYGVVKRTEKDNNHNIIPKDLSNYKIVFKGDLVLNKMKVWQGSLGISSYDGIVSPAYIVCSVTSNISGKYLNYLLRNKMYLTIYNKLSYGVRVDQWDMRYEDFKNIELFLPPKEEQDKIADFLDHNLAKIDKFVELTERQIELLKEQKEVIINDAVTKGIDNDVAYKDSGIDWIGKIPEHWEVVRLKSIVENIVSGVWGEDSKNDDNDIICIRVADFDMKKLSASKNKLTLRNIDFDKNKSRILKKGDLLLEKSGGGEKQPVGRVIQYKFEEIAVCSNFITKFTPKKLVSSKFLLFTLHNIQLRRRHIAFINQTTGIQNLDINKYFSNKILFPPKKEQEEIVAYIEKETNKIDRTIELYKNQIKLIKEYRTSLIASAVTGKIDVRDF